MRTIGLLFTFMVCSYASIAQEFCYQSCTVDPIYEDKKIVHYIFTGEDTTGMNVSITKVTVVEARREIVKRRDPNCLSPNPVECIKDVWEDIPAVTMNLYTLKDPSKTDQYDIRDENRRVMIKPESQLRETIVCPKNRTKRLITIVQERLIAKGYPITISGEFDQATALSVTDFQRSVRLPYGDLTLATLAALGIE